MSRRRQHQGTVADPPNNGRTIVLKVIGMRPQHMPYLSVMEAGERGRVLATVDHANALRGLAHAILRALGDES